MRKPSRHMHDMPHAPARLPLGLFLLLLCLLVGLVWSIVQQPVLLWVVAGTAVLVKYLSWREQRCLARLAAQRQGQSICQFARAFPRWQVDTWVIRAVYESLHGYLGGRLPIRADDRFEEDLNLDDEDLEFELLEDMARLSGRSLAGVEDNPFYGQVLHVRDLVLLLDHQPRSLSP
ncbi:hypothetical protein [Metapseudomonas otitidis]|uniref:hypothetical protein n=1 Tax=Metapseudomonas otitidis TaxID=319939 RepID=UPI001AAE5689|nr:hypothetical protein [Pseudomonas otitidis]MBO2930052.1 hypothetical protein [Pseudomonas otitidis]